MILFANTITHRLKYICDFIGTEITGESIPITDNVLSFAEHAGPKINYSDERLTQEELWIQPYLLLFEKNIHELQIDCFEIKGYKAFFKTNGDFPFDIFAASFYLLSRYEEYLPHQKDMYERYAYENSLAYKAGFLNKPLVNIWLQEFKALLQAQFPALSTRSSTFNFLPTYDIDEAYSYKHKDWKRSAGAAIKDLLRGDWRRFRLRRKVLNNELADPFDSYEWIDNLHRPYQLKPRYFFLVAEQTGKFDRNILPKEIALHTLIRQHADKYDIGIHPSWQSGDDSLLIQQEKERVEHIIQKKIVASRQHFIRFTLPDTYRHLIESGIKKDFSMGYGSINGFRASVASPFYWYDLGTDQATYLLLYPFCYMEANSFFEQKYSSQQALAEMRYFYSEVKKVNGTFITIWHNTFLGTDKRFSGWRDIYARFVNEIHHQGGRKLL